MVWIEGVEGWKLFSISLPVNSLRGSVTRHYSKCSEGFALSPLSACRYSRDGTPVALLQNCDEPTEQFAFNYIGLPFED